MNETDSKVTIREMLQNDVASVLRIGAESQLTDWSAAAYASELTMPNSIALVAVAKNEVIGFIIARRAGSVIEILNIAVLSAWRRQKIGRELLRRVLQREQNAGALECWLEVRESNAAAQQFYLAEKFKIVGERAGYYSNPPENAILMALELENFSLSK